MDSTLSTKYNPQQTEPKWYQEWMDKKFFHSEPNPDKEPYTIVIPPPNVTGVLHMGHMLNNTIQDILIRKARMEGREACWVPGYDHASIATEARVVAMLREKGINKNDLTREEFLEYAWDWKEKYGGIILEQLKKLGASCDWDRTRFTMEDEMSDQVLEVFVKLYERGKIYRGLRMVNWDPVGRTALSDDEVNYHEVASKLYYVNYQIKDSDDYVTIATTRPETILGDSAICINPEDERYQHLKGKKALVPLINREIPIIEDDYVSMEFGTGCLKITPAHDPNDYEIGQKHDIAFIDILNEDGRLNKNAEIFIGTDRFEAREKVTEAIREKGQLARVEDYTNNVGFSERTDAAIEPRLSRQWFVKMDEITKPALENVLNDNIKLVPAKFKNMYRSWMENVRDWCISRQLWWGQRIPAYYLPDGDYVVAKNPDEALRIAREKSGKDNLTLQDLQQDEDVLDTWFSSWLWPFSVFNGINEPGNKDIQYYYPTNDLVTAPEILFFWVARMIIAGYEFMDAPPFKNVYLTGIVRDKFGDKMSKSKGNSPDPLQLINDYGADGVRVGMLFSSPAGNDLLFDVKLCEQGRNFANKIWNALRLVKGWQVDKNLSPEPNKTPREWFAARLNQSIEDMEYQFNNFRISDALLAIYKLIWNDFCSWYLEMVKPEFRSADQPQVIDEATYEATIGYFETLMKLLHPFMPFITEEVWHALRPRNENDYVIVAQWPKASTYNQELLQAADKVFEVITNIRNTRSNKNIPPKSTLQLGIKTDDEQAYKTFDHVIKKLGNIHAIDFLNSSSANNETYQQGTVGFVVKADEFFLPVEGEVNIESEIETLQKELDYTKGFLQSVEKKLNNEKFVANAPEKVIANEKQKKADAEARIKTLEASIANLEGQL